MTSAGQFLKFCSNLRIKAEEIHPDKYFVKNSVEGAFLTHEFSIDCEMIGRWFMEKLKDMPNVRIMFGIRPFSAGNGISQRYSITLNNGEIIEAEKILNATYASINQISELFGFDKFNIKYEICELTIVRPSALLQEIGITVMDGPFFSIMPFGRSPFHSLTSVTFTPHMTCYTPLPEFPCQEKSVKCTPFDLDNCNLCSKRPISLYPYMRKLADKYLLPEYGYEYTKSLFAVKPILKASELDDSRPTVIKKHSSNPDFYSVLSGKLNTIYDLEDILNERE
jgi:hypothetical protein